LRRRAPSGQVRILFGPDAHLTVATNPLAHPVEALLWGLGETLTRVGSDGSIQPWLAESVTRLDMNRWRVELRPNARFWDGSAVTAEAVASSLRDKRETQIATDFMLSKKTELVIVDPLTLELITPEPTGGVHFTLSYHQLIVQKNRGALMTGPYRPVEYLPDRQLVLEPFLDHWDGIPPLERITIEYEADVEKRLAALASGEADLLYGLQPEALAHLPGEACDVDWSVTNRVHYLQFNLNRPPLDGRAVRQALCYGIDRPALLKRVFHGYGAAAGGAFPAEAGVPVAEVQRTDTAQAAHLLDAAGWLPGPDGIRSKGGRRLAFTINTFPQRAEMTPLADAVAGQVRPLGFDISVEEVPNIGERTKHRDFDAAMRSINTLISGDPYFLLAITLGRDGRENTGCYLNEEVERLLPHLKAELDEKRRQDLALQVQEQLRHDPPNAYLLVAPLITVSRRGAVTGFHADRFTQYFITNRMARP
jgi:peptide/nickel transport system substrate-binding protein